MKFITIMASAHIFMCTILFGGLESKLIYYPMDRTIKKVWIDIDKNIHDTYFYARDGVRLNAWYVRARGNKPTVIFCHGQGENISLWQNVIKFLADRGYGVFMLEYRGHGRSEGHPFESGMYVDLESAIRYLQEQENIRQNNIVLWGRSLGGAIVADVASRKQFKGVILESTFTNIRDEAKFIVKTKILESKLKFWRRFSGLMVSSIPMVQKFETDKKIAKIKSPLLIGHSTDDVTVPVQMSFKLKELNKSAKLFISESGSHHDNHWFFSEILIFLEKMNNS